VPIYQPAKRHIPDNSELLEQGCENLKNISSTNAWRNFVESDWKRIGIDTEKGEDRSDIKNYL
jgi:hypothetical protein